MPIVTFQGIRQYPLLVDDSGSVGTDHPLAGEGIEGLDGFGLVDVLTTKENPDILRCSSVVSWQVETHLFPPRLLLVEKVRIDHDDSEPGACRAAVHGTAQADADSKREVAKFATLAQEGAEQKGRRDDGFPGWLCAVMGRPNRSAATCAGSASGKYLRRDR